MLGLPGFVVLGVDELDGELGTETSDAIASRAVLTERAARRACRRVGKAGESVAAVARDLGVGWHTVMRSVWRHGQPLVDDPTRLDGVTALGMDETSFLRANRHHHTTYVSGLVDTATGRLLDVVQDCTAKAVMGWLSRRDRRWLARIGVVPLTRTVATPNAVGVHLGHATLVVDHFHIIKLANAVIDDVRRRVQNETTGHRGRKHDPLYRVRKLLLKACGDLDTQGWQRLGDGLRAGDPDGHVAAAWHLKEITRDLYRAKDIDAARDVLELRLGRLRRRPRDAPLRRHHPPLGERSAGLLRHRRCLQRTHRRRQPDHQTDQTRRPRVHQLRQLPTPPAAALRRRLARSTRCQSQEAITTLGGVEPVWATRDLARRAMVVH